MKNRCLTLLSALIVLTGISHAQALRSLPSAPIAKMEDSLKVMADSMINASSAATRFRADSSFTRGLVRALRTSHSFQYPFDSLQTVSHLYAPDSSFRIFSWQLRRDEYVFLQKGAIQMRTQDGSLKLFPLFDYSMFTPKPTDSVRTPATWIGAIYYRIILKEARGIKYYTLFGFDDYSISSSKKWIDVLTFDQRGEPKFGGPFFSFREDTVNKPVQARFNIEYKKEASALLNYDPELDLIVYDHLISESDEPAKKNTYVPDGTYEGFRWNNGQWVHVDKVFDFKLEDGQFPAENKILDNDGNINEEELQRSSQKNLENSKKHKK